jgi:hypothetical protein
MTKREFKQMVNDDYGDSRGLAITLIISFILGIAGIIWILRLILT